MRVQDFYSLAERKDFAGLERVNLVFVDETGSTNDDLKACLLEQGLRGPIGRVALVQKAGRGTRGRAWRSAAGGFYFSLAIRLDNVSPSLTLIPLAVGEGLVGALRKEGIEAALKWPNDLWFKGGKAGGILCELTKDANNVKALIVGVGLNLKGQDEQTTNGWSICGVDEEGLFNTPRLRTQLLSALLEGILDALMGDNESIIRAWRSVDAFYDRLIAFDGEQERLNGQVAGIDANGRLLLRIGNEIRAFSSGSISPYDDSFD